MTGLVCLDLKFKTESMAEKIFLAVPNADGADLSIKKCVTKKDLSVFCVLMNLMKNMPVIGRFFLKELN